MSPLSQNLSIYPIDTQHYFNQLSPLTFIHTINKPTLTTSPYIKNATQTTVWHKMIMI